MTPPTGAKQLAARNLGNGFVFALDALSEAWEYSTRMLLRKLLVGLRRDMHRH